MVLFETPHADWRAPAIAATGSNAVGVSLGSMVLYLVMLVRGSAARATATFHLVPGIAALLAWALLGETLSVLSVLGLAVPTVGCGLGARG